MITSANNKPWPLDVELKDLKTAGLPAPSVVRMKLFTIDNHIIRAKVGELAARDKEALLKSLRALLL